MQLESRIAPTERNDALHRSGSVEHANLTAAKFRARTGVTDCVLFCRVADPVRSDAWTLVTLPAADAARPAAVHPHPPSGGHGRRDRGNGLEDSDCADRASRVGSENDVDGGKCATFDEIGGLAPRSYRP